MSVKSQCLHKAVAEEYRDICREDPTFEEFLSVTFPAMELGRCYGCNPDCPGCGGEYLEEHPNPESLISGLEKMRLGFSEEPSYCTKEHRHRVTRSTESYACSGRSINLRKALPLDLELLTGDPSIDRYQVAAALGDRRRHSHDDYSLQEEFDDNLRVA